MNNNTLAPPRTSYEGAPVGAGNQYRSASLPSSSILSAQVALDDAQLRPPKERPPSEALSPEQQVLLLQVTSYFEHAGHRADEETAEYLLSSYQWNIDQTMQYCQDLVQAVQGVLAPVRQETRLSGAVNDQMTSCYIDSLLFAMFARLSAFEGLLNVNLDAESDSDSDSSSEPVHDSRKDEVKDDTLRYSHLLQTWLRMFVNQLRSGQLIQAHVIKELRQHLYSCGWNCPGPFDPPGSSRQEDASELFMFLTEKLHLPYLPLEQRLLHGARIEADDDKVITERMLQISIPTPDAHDGPPTSPTISKLESALSNLFSKASTGEQRESGSLYEVLSLEKLLAQHFYDNTLTGIRRKVSSGTGAPLSPGVEVPVSAWQVLELLPFYSSSNEQGGIIRASQSQYPADVVILPLILKRYSFGADMRARRISTPVAIPRRMDFSRFVSKQPSNAPSTSATPPPPPPPPQEDVDVGSSSDDHATSTLTVSSEPSIIPETTVSEEPDNLPSMGASSSVRNMSSIHIDTQVQPIRKYSMSLLQVADSPLTPITPPPQYSPAAHGKEFLHVVDEKKGWSPRPPEDTFGGDYMDCGPPKVKYILELKSVVCHRGTRLDSGHYRSYVADTVGRGNPDMSSSSSSSTSSLDGANDGTAESSNGFQEPNWLRHDDLDPSGQRVQLIPRNSPEDMDMEADWAQNGYILFYELQTIQC